MTTNGLRLQRVCMSVSAPACPHAALSESLTIRARGDVPGLGTTATTSRTRVVLCRHGVHFRALLVQGRTVEAYEECSAEDPVATREALSRIRALASSGASVTALFGPNSQRVHWVDGAATQQPETLRAAIRSQSGGAASNDEHHGLADAGDFRAVQAGRPAVQVSAAAAELEPFSDWLIAARFEHATLLSSTLAHAAAAVAALRAEKSVERVALWDSCGAAGAILLISAAGVEAAVPCPATWSSVVQAVQRALNLRATSTVSKLLFNDLFDFSDVAPRVAESLAAAEALLADDLVFSSPPDPHLDRDGYFARCWPHAGDGAQYAFPRLIEAGDEVVVTYEATRPDGTRLRNTEVLTFAGERIRRVEVYFGWDLT